MKNRLKLASLALIFIGLFMGCKQDFQVTGPYKELPVVYGLLNPTDSIHYIRIQKGYLIKGNAYAAGGIADSIYYPDVLKVTVKTLPNGAVYNLTRIDGSTVGINKDTGIFAHVPNLLYYFKGQLDATKTYSLQVVDTTSGVVVSAQTNITGDFTVSSPQKGDLLTLSNVNPRKIVWTPALNGIIFDLTLRFYYKEYNQANDQLLQDTFVDFIFLKSYVFNPNLAPTITVDLSSDQLFKNLVSGIKTPSGISVYRVFNQQKGMQFKFAVGGTDFANFLNAQQAQQGGITSGQTLPAFTNISGGEGIFSTRYVKEVDSVLLSNAGLDSLACSAISNPLHFRNHNNVLCQ